MIEVLEGKDQMLGLGGMGKRLLVNQAGGMERSFEHDFSLIKETNWICDSAIS